MFLNKLLFLAKGASYRAAGFSLRDAAGRSAAVCEVGAPYNKKKIAAPIKGAATDSE